MTLFTNSNGLVDKTPSDDLMCENCSEGVGHTNSRHLLDNNGDGKWVCFACEESMELTANICPCGCGNNPENCVYVRSDYG